jgi:hypothetical protein
MSTYTPGPWTTSASIGIKTLVFASSGRLVAEIRPDPGSRLVPEGLTISIEEARANAVLMAAAPDLLEALKRIRETNVYVGAIAQQMMDEAIAKAEGA